jgi:hypothetical protein
VLAIPAELASFYGVLFPNLKNYGAVLMQSITSSEISKIQPVSVGRQFNAKGTGSAVTTGIWLPTASSEI